MLLAGKNLLIIEDADELRVLYGSALSRRGFNVRSADTAEAAIELMIEWRPDVIVTDLFMPGMGGLELITYVRSNFSPPVPLILALSGYLDARAEALRRGADLFTAKPVTIEELALSVERVLANIPDPISERAMFKRRATSRAEGEAMLTRYLREDPERIYNLEDGAYVIQRFVGHSTMLTFLLQGGILRIAGSSDVKRYPLGASADAILPIANDVVESVGSIVFSHPTSRLPGGSLYDELRFLAAVPYLVDEAPVGALCLVGEVPHEFNGADLSLFEFIATRSTVSGSVEAETLVDECGVLTKAAFTALLKTSSDHARGMAGALGLALLRVAPLRPRDLRSLLTEMPAPRTAIGRIDREHLAVFSAATTGIEVRHHLAAIATQIGRLVPVQVTSELVFETPIPHLSAVTLYQWLQELLNVAGRRKSRGEDSSISIRISP